METQNHIIRMRIDEAKKVLELRGNLKFSFFSYNIPNRIRTKIQQIRVNFGLMRSLSVNLETPLERELVTIHVSEIQFPQQRRRWRIKRDEESKRRLWGNWWNPFVIYFLSWFSWWSLLFGFSLIQVFVLCCVQCPPLWMVLRYHIICIIIIFFSVGLMPLSGCDRNWVQVRNVI